MLSEFEGRLNKLEAHLGHAETCLTTQPWSAFERTADTRPTRARIFGLHIPWTASQGTAFGQVVDQQQNGGAGRRFRLSNSMLDWGPTTHKIIGNRVALVGEESVSGFTGGAAAGRLGEPTHAHLHHWQ